MTFKNLLFFFLTFASLITNAQNIQSPSAFLGYELGERFSRHHEVIDYYKYLEQTLPNVQLTQYGETYEHRPLMVAIISSQKNMDRLEEIRLNNLSRTNPSENAKDDGIAIVWLSYNIHGNESSSTEASMKTIYSLATDKEAAGWLENTVVIIDPCVNPDGRDRYANFYNQYANKNFNPQGDAIEHHEPWPGGRPNHYLFDLNRDWAWQTQTESRSRSELYHKWMPHVHVDYHEQGVNSPYYFAPAAEPFHEIITPWQREFQTMIGKNHARYFDKEGWLYFTKERFDLLYPSYGDTYPTYNGAIGMTYEQAGHGYAGLGVITEYGDTLTLKDRIAHHFTTGMSTVEITSKNAGRVINEFGNYFKDNSEQPTSKYKTYVIKNDNRDKIRALTTFLDHQNIKYGTVKDKKSYKAFSYREGTAGSGSISAEANDLVITAYQPASRLITALFEPKTQLSDSLTYDITAWSLPYAYGLETYALTEKAEVKTYVPEAGEMNIKNERPYAYLLPYQSIEDVKFMSTLLKKEVNVRVSKKALKIEGQSFDKGTLVITRRTNEGLGNAFDEIVKSTAKKFNRNIIPVSTGFSEKGVDLGSGDISRLKTPRIAVLAGDGVSSLNFGEIWHFFEQQIDYPVTHLRTDYFSYVNLSAYDVLIIPSGSYSIFNEGKLEELTTWIRAGGKVIALGRALNIFKEAEGFGLKEFATEEEKKENQEIPTVEEQLQTYGEQEREQLSDEIFGAVFKIKMDNTHPLAYGYKKEYFSLKTSSVKYIFLEKGGNVGVIQGNAKPVSGFAGYKAMEKLEDSLVFGVERIGAGQVVYMVDDPLFRAFWENGKLLFANAVFLVGN